MARIKCPYHFRIIDCNPSNRNTGYKIKEVISHRQKFRSINKPEIFDSEKNMSRECSLED